jgi:D-alanine-D-alanine ligase
VRGLRSTGAPDKSDAQASDAVRQLGPPIPLPELEPELRARLQKVALDAYRALRVRDYGRVDLRLTESGEIFVIEVNASCYLEKDSELAVAAREAGIEYPALVGRIVELALERWKARVKPQAKRGQANEAKRPRGTDRG